MQDKEEYREHIKTLIAQRDDIISTLLQEIKEHELIESEIRAMAENMLAEESLRATFPSLQDAWEKYQTLLRLVQK